MYHHIGRTLFLALCIAGFAACGDQKSPTTDLKDAAERSNNGGSREQPPGERSGDSAAATASTSTSESAADDGSATTAGTKAGDASTEAEDAPPDPNAPTVRVYQVDGTDSIEIVVDARHMKKNLSFDDPRCSVVFSLSDETNVREESKVFALENFLSRETPLLKMFRHRLGAGASAVSYAFAATQRIIGAPASPQPIKITTRRAPVLRRPIGSIISPTTLKIVRDPSRVIATPPRIDTARLQTAPLKDAVTRTKVTIQPSTRVRTGVEKPLIRRDAIRPR